VGKWRRAALPNFQILYSCLNRNCPVCQKFDFRSSQVRSPGHVKWHCFPKCLWTCQSDSFCQKDFKLAGFHKIISIYNWSISDFWHCWPKVRSIFGLPIISEQENKQMLPFQWICIGSGWFFQNYVILAHSGWPRCNCCSVICTKSSEVISNDLLITFDRIKIETSRWHHCVRLVWPRRPISNMTYLGHQMTLTWGQFLKLTLPGHRTYVS